MSLIEWLTALGMPPPALNVSAEVRFGAVTNQAVPAGRNLIELPLASVMSTTTAAQSALRPFFEEHGAQIPATVALALHVMYEADVLPSGDDATPSFWGPYLRALPAGFDTPLFWNQTELNELVGSSALAT